MRRTLTVLSLAGALAACDDATTKLDPDIDAAAADAAPADASHDAAAADATPIAPDAAPADAAPPDAVVDAAPGPHLAAPHAYVYPSDPITDNGMVTDVVLPEVTSPVGHLTNGNVDVHNCLHEPGGVTAMPDLGGFRITVSLCHEVPTVIPDPDGNYLSVRPPADDRDPQDKFAEVMMYYHVNRVHDFYKQTFDFSRLDTSLYAIVNLQIKTTPALPIPGLELTPDGWMEFPNAAFFPEQSWNELASQFGLPPRHGDSIIFGQAKPDFSYDARVIYHEYTHAMIGTDKLGGRAVDEYGLNADPPSMNEGLADYFAASIIGDPIIGKYGIGVLDPNQVRDLSAAKHCPDDLHDEVHADGRILSTALWTVRQQLGREVTDRIVFRAIQQFGQNTTMQEAGDLILAEAAAESPEAEATARGILHDYGVIDCVRAQHLTHFQADQTPEMLPRTVEGTQSVGLPGFGGGVPGYEQQYVEVPAGAAAVQVDWDMGASGGLGGLLGGGGGGALALDVVVRKDAPVHLAPNGAIDQSDATVSTPTAQHGQTYHQTAILTGACLPAAGGRVYLMFLNKQQAPIGIAAMQAQVLDAAPAPGPTVFDCGGAPAPDAGAPEPDAGASADAGPAADAQ
jgi:hypothetical protein